MADNLVQKVITGWEELPDWADKDRASRAITIVLREAAEASTYFGKTQSSVPRQQAAKDIAAAILALAGKGGDDD